MGEAKRKPEVSVLIPSRGRPDKLRRCVESITRSRNVEIIVGLDDDDPTAQGIGEEFAGLYSHVHVIYFPRHPTLGALANSLARESHGKFLMFLGDDYTIVEKDWAERLVRASSDMPNGFGVLYPHDDLHPGFACCPIIPRKVVDSLGYFMVDLFPYWFIDTWWDEIGELIGVRRPAGFTIFAPEGKGKTHGLRDLPFWIEMFEETRPIRVKESLKLGTLAFGENSPGMRKMITELARRQNLCFERTSQIRSPAFLAGIEGASDQAPSAHYVDVKTNAERLLARVKAEHPRKLKVAVCIPSTSTWLARTAVDVAGLCSYSVMSGIAICVLNIESSMISKSRNDAVEAALQAGCDYLMWIDSDMRFPPDALMRLLAHEQDIVGASYNKKTPPFETLGKLAGDRPPSDEVLHGLHEALLMPGGLMLVKAEVYRKLKWPAYFETYGWQGADGLVALKDMLRAQFVQPPPEEVLESIDDTPFAEWIKSNFVIGEFGEPLLYFSEDYNFCRKARRLGYKIWMDMDLTYEVKHIGLREVTCVVPESETVAIAAE